ncbi:ADP-ribosylglycohydrolase family protein [Mailhella massiliensis]|uniref:ADP-ribosylglycohydrolase family protein n=1 Tax=Mailhella massiliensis TaxID=1903261 RepID=A0A921DS22_9BACT|nr:ADP-ribosylglycohydrolase family protein [Mailhella massiliensis]HJD98089.1 ADP-ribosylglycohydrolase family protein [Mailhella massiliensis]
MERSAAEIRRAWGCLLGQIAGDSLGSQVEFKDEEKVRALYPAGMDELEGSALYGTLPGQPTDDSEMALALARSLVTEGGFHAEKVRAAYAAWLGSHPVDFAHSVFRALHGKVDARSEANCALMRVSPLGIFGVRFVPDTALPCDDGAVPDMKALAEDTGMRKLALLSMEEAALTNPHPVCRAASVSYVSALACGIRSGSRLAMWRAACAVVEALPLWSDIPAAESVRVRDCLERARAQELANYQENMSHVLTTLHNGFRRLLLAGSAGEGVRDTAMHGGDAAANGAVAGALLGAALDIDSFPHQWADAVLSCMPKEGRVARPRPEAYWPMDFMPLAERLLG